MTAENNKWPSISTRRCSPPEPGARTVVGRAAIVDGPDWRELVPMRRVPVEIWEMTSHCGFGRG